MMRIVRMVKVVFLTCLGVLGGHAAFGLGPEFLGPGVDGLIDLGLLVVAMVLASLTERELFWLAPSERGSSTRHPRISR